MSTAASARTRKWTWRKILAACVALLLLAATVMHQILLAILLAIVVVVVLALVLRVRWSRYAAGGWIAAWRRRRYQGWAGWRDVRRVTRSAWTLNRRLSPGTSLMVLGTRGRLGSVSRCTGRTPPFTSASPGPANRARWPAMPRTRPAPCSPRAPKRNSCSTRSPYRARLGGRMWILNPDGYGISPPPWPGPRWRAARVAMTAIRRAGDLITASPRDKSGKDALA